jgi:hypothetical protein
VPFEKPLFECRASQAAVKLHGIHHAAADLRAFRSHHESRGCNGSRAACGPRGRVSDRDWQIAPRKPAVELAITCSALPAAVKFMMLREIAFDFEGKTIVIHTGRYSTLREARAASAVQVRRDVTTAGTEARGA